MKFNIRVLSVLLFFVSLDLFTSEFYSSTQTINTSSPYYSLLNLWRITFDGTKHDNDEGKDIVVDKEGNIYVVGTIISSTTNSDLGLKNIFVAKYDKSGNLMWKDITYDEKYSDDHAGGISVDGDGNIYVIGTVNRLIGEYYNCIWISKFSKEGLKIWTKEYRDNPYKDEEHPDAAIAWQGISVVVGSDGYIYCLGKGYLYRPTPECPVLWLAKLNSEGDWIWVKTYKYEWGYIYDKWNNMAVDTDGNIYVVGDSYEERGINVRMFDKDGNFIRKWLYTEEGNWYYSGSDIVVNAKGEIFVIGGIRGCVDWQGYISSTRLLKYDAYGNLLSTYCASGYGLGYGLTISPLGHLYAVGEEWVSESDQSIWIGRFDSNLNNIWISTYDWQNGTDVGYGIAVDYQGNICVVGTVNKFGYGDIWVGKFKEEYVGSESNLSGRFSKTSYLTEDLKVEKFTINGKVNGDLTGDFNFDELVFVKIATGTFANKSISIGSFTITLDGVNYSGVWKGMGYISKNKFYINGVVSGQINGVVEGCISETNEGSGVYDLCEATWTLNQIGEETTSAKIFLSGKLNLKNAEDYPSTNLCLLQTSFEGVNIGRYYSGNLDCILSCLRIVSESNPYYNSGIAIISYNSLNGSGNIYGYAETISSTTKIEGIADSTVFGYFYGLLDESVEPKKLSVSILPVDISKLPQPNLKIKIFGPERVSPGETITYTVELRNYGLKQAEDITVVALPPTFTEFVSASDDYIYFTIAHWEDPENWQTSRVWQVPRVRWDFQTVPAKSTKVLTVQVRVKWGTPVGTSEKPQVWLMLKKTADEFFPKYDPYGDHD